MTSSGGPDSWRSCAALGGEFFSHTDTECLRVQGMSKIHMGDTLTADEAGAVTRIPRATATYVRTPEHWVTCEPTVLAKPPLPRSTCLRRRRELAGVMRRGRGDWR